MAVKDIYDRACEAVNMGNYDYGIELYRQLLKIEPEYPNARALLRGTERRRLETLGGSFVDGVVRQIAALRPRLKAMFQFKNAQQQLECMEDCLEHTPDSIGALHAAGQAAWKAGLYESAITIFKDILTLRPNNKKAMRILAQVLEENGQANEAANVLRALAPLQPYDQELQRRIKNLAALDHMQATGMEQAASFRDLIRDKNAAQEGVRRHRTAFERREELIREAHQALEKEPDNVSRIAGLVMLYRQQGLPEEGLRLLEEAGQRLPDNYEIRELSGDLQLQMRENELREINDNLKKDPGNEDLLKKKRKLEPERNEFAAREYAWRVKEHPTDHGLYLKLGQALLAMKNYDGAIAAFQIAVRDPGLEVEGATMLGQCFTAKGQHDLAVEQYNRAISSRPQLDSTGMQLYYLLASALELMGDKEQALKIYKRLYSNDISFRDVAQKVDALGK